MIRAAVLGKPIDHSLSPLVHGLIYNKLGVDYEYLRFEVDEIQARELIEGAFASSDEKWSGFSLTMPLKEIGFSLGLSIDSSALASRSINTITPSGCFNTDVSGLVRVMNAQSIEFESVSILGSGATARSVLIALEAFDFPGPVTIYRRNESRDELLPRSGRFAIETRSLVDFASADLKEDHLVVSTLPSTSQGVVSEGLRGFKGTFVDFSYAPWPSTLAKIVSGTVISGLPILVSQAVDQAAIFTGSEFDRDDVYREILSSTVRSMAATE